MAARIFCPVLFALHFLEQEKEILNKFSESRLQSFQAVVQAGPCVVAEQVCGLETPSLVLENYCRVVSLSGLGQRCPPALPFVPSLPSGCFHPVSHPDHPLKAHSGISEHPLTCKEHF